MVLFTVDVRKRVMKTLIILAFLYFIAISYAAEPYSPTWESLDSRPLPQWYDEAKIGIFLHWGVFSVPALVGSNFWDVWHSSGPDSVYYQFMKKNYRDDWTYADFANQFTAELFDANKWVELFEVAGAK